MINTQQTPQAHSLQGPLPLPLVRTILAPLDGSERAERALPVAERLAAAQGSTLRLVQVIEPVVTFRDLTGEVMLSQVYAELTQIEEETARKYLRGVAAAVRLKGYRVETSMLRGQPAPTLLDLEESDQVDLVVMASHGRGGVERFAFGSVADRIIRHGKAPVLVVRPWGDALRYRHLAHALVPLDGSPAAEAALPMVRALAGDPLHRVTLVRVVDPELSAGESERAQAYLTTACERLKSELSNHGCAVDDLVLYGDAAEQILDHSALEDIDVLVLATHGRGGAERWVMGSVADRVLRAARIPVLLVRAPKPPKAR